MGCRAGDVLSAGPRGSALTRMRPPARAGVNNCLYVPVGIGQQDSSSIHRHDQTRAGSTVSGGYRFVKKNRADDN